MYHVCCMQTCGLVTSFVCVCALACVGMVVHMHHFWVVFSLTLIVA